MISFFVGGVSKFQTCFTSFFLFTPSFEGFTARGSMTLPFARFPLRCVAKKNKKRTTPSMEHAHSEDKKISLEV